MAKFEGQIVRKQCTDLIGRINKKFPDKKDNKDIKDETINKYEFIDLNEVSLIQAISKIEIADDENLQKLPVIINYIETILLKIISEQIKQKRTNPEKIAEGPSTTPKEIITKIELKGIEDVVEFSARIAFGDKGVKNTITKKREEIKEERKNQAEQKVKEREKEKSEANKKQNNPKKPSISTDNDTTSPNNLNKATEEEQEQKQKGYAVKIQSSFRGFLARKLAREKLENNSVTEIQRIVRGDLERNLQSQTLYELYKKYEKEKAKEAAKEARKLKEEENETDSESSEDGQSSDGSESSQKPKGKKNGSVAIKDPGARKARSEASGDGNGRVRRGSEASETKGAKNGLDDDFDLNDKSEIDVDGLMNGYYERDGKELNEEYNFFGPTGKKVFIDSLTGFIPNALGDDKGKHAYLNAKKGGFVSIDYNVGTDNSVVSALEEFQKHIRAYKLTPQAEYDPKNPKDDEYEYKFTSFVKILGKEVLSTENNENSVGNHYCIINASQNSINTNYVGEATFKEIEDRFKNGYQDLLQLRSELAFVQSELDSSTVEKGYKDNLKNLFKSKNHDELPNLVEAFDEAISSNDFDKIEELKNSCQDVFDDLLGDDAAGVASFLKEDINNEVNKFKNPVNGDDKQNLIVAKNKILAFNNYKMSNQIQKESELLRKKNKLDVNLDEDEVDKCLEYSWGILKDKSEFNRTTAPRRNTEKDNYRKLLATEIPGSEAVGISVSRFIQKNEDTKTFFKSGEKDINVATVLFNGESDNNVMHLYIPNTPYYVKVRRNRDTNEVEIDDKFLYTLNDKGFQSKPMQEVLKEERKKGSNVETEFNNFHIKAISYVDGKRHMATLFNGQVNNHPLAKKHNKDIFNDQVNIKDGISFVKIRELNKKEEPSLKEELVVLSKVEVEKKDNSLKTTEYYLTKKEFEIFEDIIVKISDKYKNSNPDRYNIEKKELFDKLDKRFELEDLEKSLKNAKVEVAKTEEQLKAAKIEAFNAEKDLEKVRSAYIQEAQARLEEANKKVEKQEKKLKDNEEKVTNAEKNKDFGVKKYKDAFNDYVTDFDFEGEDIKKLQDNLNLDNLSLEFNKNNLTQQYNSTEKKAGYIHGEVDTSEKEKASQLKRLAKDAVMNAYNAKPGILYGHNAPKPEKIIAREFESSNLLPNPSVSAEQATNVTDGTSVNIVKKDYNKSFMTRLKQKIGLDKSNKGQTV